MKLIREEIESVKVITEGKGAEKKLYIEGPFLQTEKVNRNQRMYRLPTMQKEVARYAENYISKGRALGELGHPDGPPSISIEFRIKLFLLLKRVTTSLEKHKFFLPRWVKSQSHF